MTSQPKKTCLYTRVSTLDQHPETQLWDLRQLASQRGFEIIAEYSDRLSGARSSRPGLDQMLAAARRREFDVLLVWAADRLARSTKHFLDLLAELDHLGIEFVSFREQIDTGGPLGRAIMIIVGAVAELERNLIRERVKAGMRRAKLEGRRIGRRPLVIDREEIYQHRDRGYSLGRIARIHHISRTSVARILKQRCPEGCVQTRLEGFENKDSETAA